MSELGRRLKQFRELAGLSQNKLAQRAGIPRPVISDVESGNQEGVNLETARRLARALGITLDMLAGDGEKDSESEPTAEALVGA